MKSIKEKKERKKTNLEILLKDIFTLIKFIKRVDVKIGIKIEIKPYKTLMVHVIVRLPINIEWKWRWIKILVKAKFDFAIIKYFIYIPISKGNPYILINRNKIDFLFLLAMQRCEAMGEPNNFKMEKDRRVGERRESRH